MNEQDDGDDGERSPELVAQLGSLKERAAHAKAMLELHRRNGSFDDDYQQAYFLIEALDLQLSRLLQRPHPP